MQDNSTVLDLDAFPFDVNVKCKYSERTLSYANRIVIPTLSQDLDAVFKECCYTHVVLASTSDSADFKNDYSGFYHQRQISNETVNFILYRYSNGLEYPLIDGSYGSFFNFGYFPTNPNLKGYLVRWRKVLQAFGEGSYKIIKRQNIAGILIETSSITFTLKNYSGLLADKTARIDIVMNGRIEKDNVEFKGTGWKHSLRVPGFFGRREPQYTEDNIIESNFNKRQISMTQTNEYKFQTNLIPSCITSEIIDFMLFANDIFMNDYNLNNHTYDYVKFGVKFASNEGTGYSAQSRKARLNLVFNDKFVDRIKRNFD